MSLALLSPAAATAAPNDPLFPQQGNLLHLHVTDALAALARPLAPAIVAVPDTGISHTNPDLAPVLWSNPAPVPAPNPNGQLNPVPTVPAGAHGWNSLGTNPKDTFPSNANPGDANTDPPNRGEPDFTDANNHGTFIAGIPGAASNNATGITGMAPNTQLMALRTCWEDDDCYQSINAPAFNWAAARGARVVSMSWDWANNSSDVEPAIVAAIRNNPNTLFVGVASNGGGNYDQTPNQAGYYPCALNLPGDPAAGGALPNFICTTAIADAGLCGFAGRDVDVASYVDHGFTTVPAFQGDGFTALGCSTSAAATTVDGVAALLFGLYPQATGAQVKAWIISGARADPSLSGQVASGAQLDALGAVQALQTALWTPTLALPVLGTVDSTSAQIGGRVDTRGIAGEHVAATYVPAGRPPSTAVVPVRADGSYTVRVTGLPPASTVAVTVTAYADGAGAPPWVLPASHVLSAQRMIAVSTAAASGARSRPRPGHGRLPRVGRLRFRRPRSHRRGVRATLLASATVDGGGLPTAWELQIQRVRIRRHHRSRVFVTVAHGGLHRRSISATLHGKRASVVTVRLRAHNALGSATGRPRRTRFPR